MTSIHSTRGVVEWDNEAPPRSDYSGIRRTLQDAFALAVLEGIVDVRVLLAADRSGQRRHKVFVVVAGVDISRDEKVIEILEQVSGINYDLVPEASAGMIPDAATSVLC